MAKKRKAKKRNTNGQGNPPAKGEIKMEQTDNESVETGEKEVKDVELENVVETSEETAPVVEESLESGDELTEGGTKEEEGDAVTQAPTLPEESKEDEVEEDVSEVVGMIEARKAYFDTTPITPLVKNTICESMARIAIKLYESGTTSDFTAYLNYLVERPGQISSISFGMDMLVKNGQKQREEVNFMQAAFGKLARARRNKVQPKVNVSLLSEELSNKDVVNFIASMVG